MYETQKEKDIKKQAKMIEIVLTQNRKEIAELKQAQPCENSRKIVKHCRRKGSVHNRLFMLSQTSRRGEISAGDEPSKSFIEPKIIREKNSILVTDRLMNDAKKRQRNRKSFKKEITSVLKKDSKPSKATKSQGYAFKKFLKEYQDVLIELGKEKNDDFSFGQLCQVLLKMGFITSKDEIDKDDGIVADVWVMMGGETENVINENSIYHILCIILNFDKPFLYATKSQNKHLQDTQEFQNIDKSTVGMISEAGVFYLRNKGEFPRLHSYFYDLTFNRISHNNIQSIEKKSRIKDNKLKPMSTFQPKINSVSESIELNKNEKFGKLPRHELLLHKGKAYKQAKVYKENLELSKELDGCTFAPNTAKARSKILKSKTKARNSISIEEAKSNFKNSLLSFNLERESDFSAKKPLRTHRGNKRVKPKINKIILDIISGKDPMVHSTDVYQQYNTIQGTSTH
ncbi:unnamed protein product [Moneuplotes crassus]|uniref:Uncharacterized protein n=1 Tax=Euplotes crassus TaxID=5936 RepID=A0AAD1Y949_EUPCR|nr:unnamed protein product [Moneuplotes crassus]